MFVNQGWANFLVYGPYLEIDFDPAEHLFLQCKLMPQIYINTKKKNLHFGL